MTCLGILTVTGGCNIALVAIEPIRNYQDVCLIIAVLYAYVSRVFHIKICGFRPFNVFKASIKRSLRCGENYFNRLPELISRQCGSFNPHKSKGVSDDPLGFFRLSPERVGILQYACRYFSSYSGSTYWLINHC